MSNDEEEFSSPNNLRPPSRVSNPHINDEEFRKLDSFNVYESRVQCGPIGDVNNGHRLTEQQA